MWVLWPKAGIAFCTSQTMCIDYHYVGIAFCTSQTMCIDYHYVGIAFCTSQQCALIIIMWVLHFAPLNNVH
jgi:uncharacterized metal-binding protein